MKDEKLKSFRGRITGCQVDDDGTEFPYENYDDVIVRGDDDWMTHPLTALNFCHAPRTDAQKMKSEMRNVITEVDRNDVVRWYDPDTNLLHRENGPAVIFPNGNVEWWFNGEVHREDGPAVVWPQYPYLSGRYSWYLNSRCFHSVDDYKIAVAKLNCERVKDHERE